MHYEAKQMMYNETLGKAPNEIEMRPPEKTGPLPIECSRCGECCKAFTLPWSEDQLIANREAAQRGDRSEYHYTDRNGEPRKAEVNPMMALWSEKLTPCPPSDAAESFLESGLHWYSCGHLVYQSSGKGAAVLNALGVEAGPEEGQYSCGIHENRPYVCRKYKPATQGGYIYNPKTIIYPECSYRTEWESKDREKARESDGALVIKEKKR